MNLDFCCMARPLWLLVHIILGLPSGPKVGFLVMDGLLPLTSFSSFSIGLCTLVSIFLEVDMRVSSRVPKFSPSSSLDELELEGGPATTPFTRLGSGLRFKLDFLSSLSECKLSNVSDPGWNV